MDQLIHDSRIYEQKSVILAIFDNILLEFLASLVFHTVSFFFSCYLSVE